MLWAALYLPQLALDAVARTLDDAESPWLLMHGPMQRRVVYAASHAAGAVGIQPGQPLAAAQVLCPEVRILNHDPTAAAHLRDLLVAWAYGYSSQVCQNGEDTIWVEVGGSLGLFGPWPRLERQLRSTLDDFAIQHRIALAPTPLGAEVLARASDGIAVFDVTTLRRALDPLPIEHGSLDEDTLDTLQGMGIRQLRQLFALPRAGLNRRFGRILVQQIERLLGETPDPHPLYRPPERFLARCEFDHEISLSTALLFPLRRMLGDLGTYLIARDGGVTDFEIGFEHDEHPPSRQHVGLLQPERDSTRLFDLAKLTLERVQLPAPVRALLIHAEHLPPFIPTRHDLFDTRPASALDWVGLHARLAARLGAESCQQLALVADPRPEYAQRGVAESSRPAIGRTLLPRPSWLLERPTPLRDPDLRILAGPERIESGWWDGDDVRRDYYVVETSRGQRAWAFCAPGEVGPFMLHGWFA